MKIEEIVVLMPYITALAAVICPILSSVISVRSNERTKRSEQYTPQKYAAVKRFTETYSAFHRSADYIGSDQIRKEFLDKEAAKKYREFCAAAYEVISFVPNREIQDQITDLLSDLEGVNMVNFQDDKKFQTIAIAISKELSLEMSTKKKKRIGSKYQSNKTE